MTPIKLPTNWDLVLDDDPMSGGITRRAVLGHGTDDEIRLTAIGIPEKLFDAVLRWKHTLPDPIKLHDGTTARVADVFSSQISGATDRAAAIRAVVEAAIIAGWARR